MELPIIFADDDVIVVNKPAGIVVNRADSVKEPTVQDWMENQNSELQILNDGKETLSKEEQEFKNRSGVVHRLDKETSGIMVLAKNTVAFQNIKNQFKDRKTEKEYRALVHGRIIPDQGTINLPLKRNPLNRHRFTVSVDGKMARTRYQVEKIFAKEDKKNYNEMYTLVHLYPKTGRTHQLRVHLAHLGYPIVSDPVYLGKRLSADLLWCPRLFLHAHRLAFFHPRSGERVSFTAELPSDLKKAIEKLNQELGDSKITNNQETITK